MGISFWVPVLTVVMAVPAAVVYVLQIIDKVRIFRLFPPEEYRVTNVKDGRGLWTAQETQNIPLLNLTQGQTYPPTCSFTANKNGVCVIEGPLRREPLQPGKYRATFRIKVRDVDLQAPDQYLLNLEVLSHIDGRVEDVKEDGKVLALRTVTTYDFEKAGEKDFSLDFEVYSKNGGGEQKLEFCIISWKCGIRVTFDSVRLSRR
jgi:hypothetical protein